MTNKNNDKHRLKDLYTADTIYKWMEVISDKETDHVCFSTYKNQKKRLARLVKYIKFSSDNDVVEYGCGNGLWADIISTKIKSYTGVDFSETFINLAQRRSRINKIGKVQFRCQEIVEFTKVNRSKYDQAFSMDFSEHVDDNDFMVIFKAIKDTLKPGGELYIHTPNANYFIETLKKIGVLKQDVGHIGIRNNKQYMNLLYKAGFKKIETIYLPHYICPLSYIHCLSFLPGVGKFFKARLLIKCS